MEQQEIVSSKNACQQKFTQQCTVKAEKKPRWGWKSTSKFKLLQRSFLSYITCGNLIMKGQKSPKFDLQSQFSMSKINQGSTKRVFN